MPTPYTYGAVGRGALDLGSPAGGTGHSPPSNYPMTQPQTSYSASPPHTPGWFAPGPPLAPMAPIAFPAAHHRAPAPSGMPSPPLDPALLAAAAIPLPQGSPPHTPEAHRSSRGSYTSAGSHSAHSDTALLGGGGGAGLERALSTGTSGSAYSSYSSHGAQPRQQLQVVNADPPVAPAILAAPAAVATRPRSASQPYGEKGQRILHPDRGLEVVPEQRDPEPSSSSEPPAAPGPSSSAQPQAQTEDGEHRAERLQAMVLEKARLGARERGSGGSEEGAEAPPAYTE